MPAHGAARAEDRLEILVRVRPSHRPRCRSRRAQSPRRLPARPCRPQTSAHTEHWSPPRSAICAGMMSLKTPKPAWTTIPCVSCIRHRDTRLPHEHRRGRKQAAHAGLNHLVERLGDVMGEIKKRSGGRANSRCWFTGLVFHVARSPAGERGVRCGLIRVHRIQVKIACRYSLFQRNRKRPALCVSRAIGELRQIVVNRGRHGPFAEVVVAHIDAPRINAESIVVFAARPDPGCR